MADVVVELEGQEVVRVPRSSNKIRLSDATKPQMCTSRKTEPSPANMPNSKREGLDLD